MADWVHCNKCTQRYRPKVKYFLNECGHIMCEKCHGVMVSNNGMCIVCGKSSKSILLDSEMPHDVQCFFKPLPAAIEALKQVYEFQHKNEMSLAKDLSNKYQYAKQEVMKSFKNLQELKRENQRLNAMLNNAQRPSLGGCATSTPMVNACGPSPINSVSSSVRRNHSFKFMGSPNLDVSRIDYFKRPGYAQRTLFRSEVSMDIGNTPSPASSAQVVPGARRFTMPEVHGQQRPFLNFPPQTVRRDKRPA